jgi:hypothetical protein
VVAWTVSSQAAGVSALAEPGRPTMLHRRSARQVAVMLPQRHCGLAGQILAGAVEHASLISAAVGQLA